MTFFTESESSESEDGPDDDLRLASVPPSFEGLFKFNQLASLRFDFLDEFVEEAWGSPKDPSYHLRMQRAVLEAVSSNPLPAIKSLVLNNLVSVPSELFESPQFAALLRPLETLSIYVLGPYDLSEGVYAWEPLGEFWEQLTPVLAAAEVRGSSTPLTISWV